MKKIIIIIVTIMVAATVNTQTIKERGMGFMARHNRGSKFHRRRPCCIFAKWWNFPGF